MESSLSDAEIVTLGSSSETCTDPPDYPLAMRGAHGTFHAGNVIICGGYDPATTAANTICRKFSYSTG